MAPKFLFARRSLDTHARAEAFRAQAKTMPSPARDVIDHLINEWTKTLREFDSAVENLLAQIEAQEQQLNLEQGQLRRQRALFERAPCPLLLLDEQNRVREVSSAAVELWHAPREWLVGKRLAPFFPHQDLDEHLSAARSSDGRSWEAVLMPRSGPSVGVVMQAAPIRETEDGLYVAVVQLVPARDEPEPESWREAVLERALEQLKQVVADLRDSDERKRAFLMAIAHDLRSPVAALRGVAETLGQPRLPARDRDMLLRRLVHRSREMEKVLGGLLDFGRIADDHVQPYPEETNVAALINRVVSGIEMGRRRVVVDVPLDRPLFVDPAIVERIVDNLASNGARHTPEQSTVWISARPQEEGLLLTVEDDGVGVPDDLKTEIFEPYRRFREGGVGVGLWVVGKLAEVHGGEAWVEDRSGGGASFRVALRESKYTAAPGSPVTDRSAMVSD